LKTSGDETGEARQTHDVVTGFAPAKPKISDAFVTRPSLTPKTDAPVPTPGHVAVLFGVEAFAHRPILGRSEDNSLEESFV